MTPTEIRAAVRGLRTQGHGLREISRLLAMSRNTVRRILRVSRIALSDGAESTIFDGLPASASGVL